jgi:histone chaperone ASF1
MLLRKMHNHIYYLNQIFSDNICTYNQFISIKTIQQNLQAVLDNPAPFLSPFSFEITFECLQPLSDDLEWKVLYVGSAEDTSHDQVLDEILVGPIPVGINKFVLQADAPDISQIPEGDILGVTVVLVTCSYREKEFVRVGYYVNNEYTEEYDEEVGPPKPLDMNKVRRSVLAEKPRVTRFPIQWGDNKDEEIENVQQNGQGGMEGYTMEEAKMAGASGVGEDSMMIDAVME